MNSAKSRPTSSPAGIPSSAPSAGLARRITRDPSSPIRATDIAIGAWSNAARNDSWLTLNRSWAASRSPRRSRTPASTICCPSTDVGANEISTGTSDPSARRSCSCVPCPINRDRGDIAYSRCSP